MSKAILEELEEMGVTGQVLHLPQAPASDTEFDSRLAEAIASINEACESLKLAATAVNEAVSGFGQVLAEAVEEEEGVESDEEEEEQDA